MTDLVVTNDGPHHEQLTDFIHGSSSYSWIRSLHGVYDYSDPVDSISYMFQSYGMGLLLYEETPYFFRGVECLRLVLDDDGVPLDTADCDTYYWLDTTHEYLTQVKWHHAIDKVSSGVLCFEFSRARYDYLQALIGKRRLFKKVKKCSK